jgi:prepilin-type N-terminal cleavage/methylation domain-containing protein
MMADCTNSRQASRIRSPRQSLRSAYTLLELLMVIALLGLAASLLIPHMTGRGSLDTQAAVRMLIADLSFAQSDAMAHQELRRVHFYDDGRGYCIVRVLGVFDEPFDPDTAQYVSDPIAPAGHLGRYIVDFTADKRFTGVTLPTVSIDGGQRHITYDTLGGTVAGGGALPGIGGSITVSSNEATYQINIAPFTGKITVERIND